MHCLIRSQIHYPTTLYSKDFSEDSIGIGDAGMYYLTRSSRRVDAVRQIYGCAEDIRILESVVRVSDNIDNLYEIWDGEGDLVKIAPKEFDYMQFKDGGWVHASDIVQVKYVDIREPGSHGHVILRLWQKW